ncbi:MAG: dTDP-glucose 4,6-dehydratase [Acidobacteria bacterium]|nr:dTDP-glucose 4,6-dehydratase [Acidobacteriota bacterium]
MATRRLLVTGGAGFIGANFVHYWAGRHDADRIVVLDLLTYAGNRTSLAALESDPRFRFMQGDIVDTELVRALLDEENIDTIVHFAAESHVDRSIHGPADFVRTNLMGTAALLEACRLTWPAQSDSHHFHHVSTDEVYGTLGPDDPAFREDKQYEPNSPYAASKAGSDHLVRAYHHTYGLRVTTSNCSNNYGPYQFPEKLIPLMIVNLLTGKPLPIYGDGLNVRDWLHVEDHCVGIEAVIERGRVDQTYNVGGGNEWTNLDLVHGLCDLLDEQFTARPDLATRFPDAPPAAGKSCRDQIEFVTDRPGHDRRYAIDGEKMASELDFRPRIGFTTGLRSTVDWYLDNEAWWRAVLDGSYRDWVAKQYEG